MGSSDVLNDGAGILDHVFGGKQQNVAQAVGAKSGMDVASVMKLLQIAAPVVMGYLGKQSKQQNIKDGNGIESLLGDLLVGEAQKEQSLITKILDANGDGSVIDDLIGMASGSKKKGEIGRMFVGVFGGK